LVVRRQEFLVESPTNDDQRPTLQPLLQTFKGRRLTLKGL
jgi:hypothetical protein